ncbi:membrane protein implicated in regulation of membrane protease activity [Paenibacillus shirakamiensis]|uniref:Membrane protein implicated in regulation of membrane protease activity n=1 Tax=Paenibacillus shirakamiensis TaxID=1265935 RepID=A0ABS4JLW7_9BACL|nr:hypothetical protein [Paenibacillus shirakamiensis]MBP2002096.1 membrane protein implicated in regulation of membrane protease activity [Paenibacillus shirakamiensis]
MSFSRKLAYHTVDIAIFIGIAYLLVAVTYPWLHLRGIGFALALGVYTFITRPLVRKWFQPKIPIPIKE